LTAVYIKQLDTITCDFFHVFAGKIFAVLKNVVYLQRFFNVEKRCYTQETLTSFENFSKKLQEKKGVQTSILSDYTFTRNRGNGIC
jgi:hypothetical protein